MKIMNEILVEDLKLINGGSEESYNNGKEFGYNFGRILKAIGHIIDTLSPLT